MDQHRVWGTLISIVKKEVEDHKLWSFCFLNVGP